MNWEQISRETGFELEAMSEAIYRYNLLKDFRHIAHYLDTIARNYEQPLRRRGVVNELRRLAEKLANMAPEVKVFQSGKSLKDLEFFKIGGINILIAKDQLTYDIDQGREWLSEYRNFLTKFKEVSQPDPIYLVELGRNILSRALELCPYRTGRLKYSGTLFQMSDGIAIAFLAPYATYVHDDMNRVYKHGQAKFLEQALKEYLPNNTVWTETVGENVVWCSLLYNKQGKLIVNYKHYA